MTLTVDIDLDQLAAAVAELMPARDSDWPEWMDLKTVAKYADKPESTIRKSTMPRHQPEGKGGRVSFYRPEVDEWMRGM